MGEILDSINVIKTIKKYRIIKKIERHSENADRGLAILFVDFLILVAVATAAYYVYFINKNSRLEIGVAAAAVIFILCYIQRVTTVVWEYENQYTGIKKLILIDEEGEEQKEWEIEGQSSLLIGKNTGNSEVDIDLSNTEYAALVSKQHAVLNFAADNWFIEDIGSSNGIGIKKINDNVKSKLESDKPYKLDIGDILYIANTKLLAK